MKYYIENIKRHLVYIYLLIKNKKYFSKLYYDIPSEERKLFYVQNKISDTLEGSFFIINNKWGAYKIKANEIYIQNIYKLKNKIGFSFITPNKNRGVIGFPELLIGKSPFGGVSTTSYLPCYLYKIYALESSYDVSMYIEPKKYNLVFDLWITKSDVPTVKDIVNEIMIWEDRNVARPAGKYIKTVNFSFGKYKIYHTWMDRSSENLGTNGWYFTAFVRQDRRRVGNVNLQEIIQLMINDELVSKYRYLSSVEFGNEVYNATGYTIINQYDLLIKNNLENPIIIDLK